MFATLLLSLVLAQVAAAFQEVYQRGLQALANGQFEEAEAALREAQRLQPDNPVVHYQLAELFTRSQQWDQAIARLREAIRLEPREPQFYVRLALLQTQLKRFHDAHATLNELLQVRPDYPETHLLFGRVAEEQGDHALAEPHLRDYVRFRPEDPTGLGELGVVLLVQGKFEEAESLLKRVLEKDPNSGAAHYNLGLLYSRRGQHQQAKHHLEHAIPLLAEKAQAYHQLGTVLVRVGELPAAEKWFRQALELSPAGLESLYALGTLLRRQGRTEEANKILAEHERLSAAALEERQRGRRVSAYHQEVKELLKRDRLNEAQKKVDEILQLDPENDLAYYRLAQIFYLRGEYERALETVQRAIARKKFEPAYHSLQAMCWEKLGQDDKAAGAYERVLSLAEYTDTYWALARLEQRRGNFSRALAHLRRAVALEPENPELRLALAAALEEAGESEESRKERAKARALQEEATPR
ncbi:MAG: tetratricopeptide repeat protein [Acidobacteria bacterium]|nr:tetratricopeptide repeat protein [Acidobacteriota bacterium]